MPAINDCATLCAQGMSSVENGFAFWDPQQRWVQDSHETINKPYPLIRPGDVGYVDKDGGFIRLLNIHVPEDRSDRENEKEENADDILNAHLSNPKGECFDVDQVLQDSNLEVVVEEVGSLQEETNISQEQSQEPILAPAKEQEAPITEHSESPTSTPINSGNVRVDPGYPTYQGAFFAGAYDFAINGGVFQHYQDYQSHRPGSSTGTSSGDSTKTDRNAKNPDSTSHDHTRLGTDEGSDAFTSSTPGASAESSVPVPTGSLSHQTNPSEAILEYGATAPDKFTEPSIEVGDHESEGVKDEPGAFSDGI